MMARFILLFTIIFSLGFSLCQAQNRITDQAKIKFKDKWSPKKGYVYEMGENSIILTSRRKLGNTKDLNLREYNFSEIKEITLTDFRKAEKNQLIGLASGLVIGTSIGALANIEGDFILNKEIYITSISLVFGGAGLLIGDLVFTKRRKIVFNEN